MGLIVSDTGGGHFEPAPAGTHRAVCVDVVDLGLQETKFGKKPKIRVVWEIEERMPDGRPFIVSQRYTPSLAEKANLRHDLESWRGRPFSADELGGFDLEKLLGAPALVNVIHRPGNDGRIWANIASVSPLPKTLGTISPSGKYTRVKEREPDPATTIPDESLAGLDELADEFTRETEDDDIPF